MNVYTNTGNSTNLVIDGRAIHVRAGETIHCKQEINNPLFCKGTVENAIENTKDNKIECCHTKQPIKRLKKESNKHE